MGDTPKKKTHRKAKAGTLLIAAAGLAAAGLIYLKRRGIKPSDAARRAKRGAQSAASILSGEARAAYNEVRGAILDSLTRGSEEPSKDRVFTTINKVLADLKKHGDLTTTQLKELGAQLKTEWQDLQKSAQRDRVE